MSFKLGYRPELDGLRAVAVLSVMSGHSAIVGMGADLTGKGIVGPLLVPGGLFGVDIFFVLSGFLITTLLLQEHGRKGWIDYRAFYIRRALRLGPAMVLLLVASSFYILFFRPPDSRFDWISVIFSAAYVSNFALIFYMLRLGMLTPTWSLSVEEQFYAIWPLTLTWMLKSERARVIRITLLLAIGSAALRAAFYFVGKTTGSWPIFASANVFIFARTDSLLCGALVAMFANWGYFERWNLPRAAWAAIGALGAAGVGWELFTAPSMEPTGVYGPGIFYFAYAFISIMTALLVAALVASPPRWIAAFLRLPPMVWTGKISYALYLYHLPVFSLFPNAIPDSTPSPAAQGWVLWSGAMVVTYACAALSYYLVEKRCLDLKHLIGQPRETRAGEQPGMKPSAT